SSRANKAGIAAQVQQSYYDAARAHLAPRFSRYGNLYWNAEGSVEQEASVTSGIRLRVWCPTPAPTHGDAVAGDDNGDFVKQIGWDEDGRKYSASVYVSSP
ncbi:hypothetical protein ACHAWF_015004, partial [Thalassiosira exigua]